MVSFAYQNTVGSKPKYYSFKTILLQANKDKYNKDKENKNKQNNKAILILLFVFKFFISSQSVFIMSNFM